MGSQFVSKNHGFPRGRFADEVNATAERNYAARQVAERAKAVQTVKPAGDTLELSSRQHQQMPGQVQFAPVRILVSGIDYMA